MCWCYDSLSFPLPQPMISIKSHTHQCMPNLPSHRLVQKCGDNTILPKKCVCPKILNPSTPIQGKVYKKSIYSSTTILVQHIWFSWNKLPSTSSGNANFEIQDEIITNLQLQFPLLWYMCILHQNHNFQAEVVIKQHPFALVFGSCSDHK